MEKDTITWAPFGLASSGSGSCPIARCGVEPEEAGKGSSASSRDKDRRSQSQFADATGRYNTWS